MGEPVKVDILVQQIRQEAAELLRDDPCNEWAKGFTEPTEQKHACADIADDTD